MSGNASRKYKQYKMMQERRKLFGDLSARDEFGNTDLVAYSAAKGRIYISRSSCDPARSIHLVKKVD